MTTAVEELSAAKYALLTTYRRDGSPVATPVWTVPYGGSLAIWTGRKTGKVKRIRRNATVTIATCDFRGNDAGPAHTGQASLLDKPGSDEVRRGIRRKYGISGWLTLTGSRLRGGTDGTVGILVTLTA